MQDLIVPVYLNQKLVFDLLAMLQGGISTVKSVVETSSGRVSSQEEISTQFGLSGAVSSLLSISLGGHKTKESQNGDDVSVSEEKIQTPASLLYQLLGLLNEQRLIKNMNSVGGISPGDFVELSVCLEKNPALDSLQVVHGILNLIHSMQDSKTTKKFIEEKQKIGVFIESLKSGSSVDMIGQNLGFPSVVVTLEKEFLRDPSMSDVVDGQFKVFGKVIKVIDEKSKINLLRKSDFGRMPEEQVHNLLGKLIDPLTSIGYSIPSLTVSIDGPAIHILPVAVYA